MPWCSTAGPLYVVSRPLQQRSGSTSQCEYIYTHSEVNFFSGNISIPNRKFNTITAIVTFATLLWFGIAKINRKGKLAKARKVDSEIIFHTQKDMFKESLKTASLVGLGAYFITRQIPSAFELSIFTFELIALLSPFTLDKLIQGKVK